MPEPTCTSNVWDWVEYVEELQKELALATSIGQGFANALWSAEDSLRVADAEVARLRVIAEKYLGVCDAIYAMSPIKEGE